MNTIIEKIRAEIERQEKQCPLDTYEGRHRLFILGGLKTFLSDLEKSEKPNSTNWEQIEKRAKESEKALDYMREHPLTHEQAVEQAQRLKEEEKSTTAEGLEEEIEMYFEDWDSNPNGAFFDKEGYKIGIIALKSIARHFYELGRQSLKDKDTFDEADNAILELVIRAIQERKDEDTGYEKHYDRLLSWLNELPNWVRCKPKVCEGLEEEIRSYLMTNRIVNHSEMGWKRWGEQIASHFAQWGAEHRGSSEIPKDLEEAAKKEYPCDKSWMTPDMLDLNAHKQVAFRKGAKWDRQQMLKDAVEGEVVTTNKYTSVRYLSRYGTFRYFYGISGGFQKGDKVKLIIVKED